MRIKRGKHGADIRYIHPACVMAASIAWALWQERFPTYPMVITSCGEGKHQDGSRHYLSMAFDVRTVDPSGKWKIEDDARVAYVHELRNRIGDEFDVTVSQRFMNIHVELDPKENLR